MIRFEKVTKTFETSAGEICALSEIDLNIEKGCIFGVIGSSGAGKSTLVRCMNLLERPTSGNVYFDDVNLTKLPMKELRQMRRKISMIFQQFNLLEQRDALGNVCYPLEISGVPSKEAKEKAKKLLEMVGLEDRMHSFPAQLSGGQKQRVAIARALATDPDVLLCDEATSALDPGTTRAILDLLKDINEKLGVTIIVITHEMKVVEQICDKVAVINDGVLVESGDVKAIFLKPQSKVTRQLLFPQKDDFETATNQRVIPSCAALSRVLLWLLSAWLWIGISRDVTAESAPLISLTSWHGATPPSSSPSTSPRAVWLWWRAACRSVSGRTVTAASVAALRSLPTISISATPDAMVKAAAAVTAVRLLLLPSITECPWATSSPS